MMRGGQRITAATLEDSRRHATANLARLPEPLRRLQEPYAYRVEIAAALHQLAEQVDHGLAPCAPNDKGSKPEK